MFDNSSIFRNCLFTFFTVLPIIITAQNKNLNLSFEALFNNEKLVLEKEYKSIDNQIIKIEAFRFYVSDIEILSDKNEVFRDSVRFHLVDFENPKTTALSFNIPFKKYSAISLYIGIDSLTNVSGAMGGDLDPTKGMYWTWQSGYINFKMEGKHSAAKSRNNKFQYHLGGFAFPFATIQKLNFKLKSSKQNICITFPVEKFLNLAKPEQLSEIMSPGDKAVALSKSFLSLFSLRK
jgi:hypothetical protein